MRVLVGYDGSVDADGALQDLRYAGLPAKAAVRVLTLAAPWEPLGPEGMIPVGFGEEYDEFRAQAGKEARALAEKAAASLRKHFPGWSVTAEGRIDQPVRGLLEAAGKWKPSLIVLGSHGRTALSRMLLGSVSQGVLHRSTGSVRITRPRTRSRRGPPRLLLGVDGSADSAAAVARVAAGAWPEGTQVHVLGVLGLPSKSDPGWGEFRVTLEAELNEARLDFLELKVSAAAEALARKGLQATPKIQTGDARKVLLEEAGAWGADCIFLGSRGLGALERFFLGSVSSAVASHAPCTVEVVRTADRKTDSNRNGETNRKMKGKE